MHYRARSRSDLLPLLDRRIFPEDLEELNAPSSLRSMAFKGKFAFAVIFIQITFIVVYAFFVSYTEDADASHPKNHFQNSTESDLHALYPMFQDNNAIIFIGVGFLYTFLKKYGYSGVGMNMLLAALSIQWTIITHNWWNTKDGRIHLDMTSLLTGEFGAASAVIALGGVFGKVSPLQMIIFTLFEVLIYTTNEHFCIKGFHISDVAGSVSLHMFAGIFGCSVAYAVDRKVHVQNNPNESPSYESNIFCMLGTVLLWCFWPSFNSSLSTGDAQYRSVINTFLALLGSCMMAFAISSLLHKDKKFTMGQIQNATLAGGVAIGTCTDLMIQPFGALLIGSIGGTLCVVGFNYLAPFLARMNIYDPCGINSLHALPGFFAGITGVIAALIANEQNYGHSLYKLYPAMAPMHNSSELMEILKYSPDVAPGLARTAPMQACFQFLYVIEVMLVAILTGLITGIFLRLQIFDPVDDKQMYLDDPFWVVPEIKDKKSSISNQMNDSKI
ncbi:ammonium transporter Rh type A-like isoform X3 [Argiope bruennichi]|uniref:ammonium transporter Rh type A-like isoform X3 n=1 Tax=Argiope bruennichi TaxID=94029 RepID=UPI0024945551|nr:ammonium transporter Rh type A-like isoform X3 [Argiope bruennichi]